MCLFVCFLTLMLIPIWQTGSSLTVRKWHAGFRLQLLPHSCFFPRSNVQAAFQGSFAMGLVNA